MNGLFLAAAAETSSAYRAGYVVGAVAVPAALLVGLLVCIVRLSRPGTNRWGVASLMLLLAGWLAAAAGSVVKTVGAPEPLATAAPMLGVAAALLFLPAAIVLAIVALATHGRHPEWVRGRAAAISTLVAGGLTLVLFAGAALVGMVMAVQKQQRTLARADWTSETDVQRFEALNCTYSVPPSPYVRWEVKGNAAVTTAFLRSRPTVFFMLIAEHSTADLQTDSSTVASVAQANLASTATSPTFGPIEPHVVNGLAGARFTADAVVNGNRFAYSYWTYASNGYLYQLITSGAQADRARVTEEADQLVRRFRILDTQRRAAAAPPEPLRRFESPAWPYTLTLEEPGWMTWPEAPGENPGVEVGATLGDAALLVTPFRLTGERPHADALAQALLKEWQIEFPSADVRPPRPVESGGLRGYDLAFKRTVDDKVYDYRLRVLADERWALEAAVWREDGKPGLDAMAERVFRGLVIDARPVPETPGPGTPRAKDHARLYNRLGLFHHAARDYAAGRRFFEAAVRLDDRDRAYLLNLVRAWSDSGAPKEALAFLQQTAHPDRDHEEVRSWRAWLLKEDGQKAAALAVYDGLFAAEAYRNDEDFEAYAALLADAGRWDDFTRAFDRYAGREGALKLRLAQSRLLAEGERDAEAVTMLEATQKTMPFSTDIAFALARHHRSLEQHRKVLEICDELIRRGFESAAVHYMKGDAQVGLKWYRAAKATFEKALKSKPGDKDTAEYLQYVSGLLGEGNNSAIKEAIAPVPLPAALAPRLAAAASRPDPSGFGAHYVHLVDGFRFVKGREQVQTTRQRLEVTDASGVERFSTLEVAFHPLSERVFVNELVVRDGEGKVVSRGQARDYYVVDDQSDGMATHRQTLYIPVPGLEPGHTVDLTVSRRALGEPDAFSYESFVFSAPRPVRLRAVYYLGDPALVRHQASKAVSHERLADGLLWLLEEAPVYPREARRQNLGRFAPTLRLAPADDDWPTLARAYGRELEVKLGAEPSVSALAERLTRGLRTREEKVQALLRHVHGGYVYKPIEFGRRARIPNTAGDTIQKKYGDCKDHSVLLRQLLGAIDVPAHLALVNTGEDVHPELPSLDQFDHMIVFVPGEAGSGAFYDGTDKSLDPRAQPPLGLGGRPALVLDPARPRFESIPDYPADSSRARVDRRVRLGADGRLAVTESLELTGYYASSMRSHLKSMESAKYMDWAQGELARWVSGSELVSFAAHELKDAGKPVRLELEYAAALACVPEASGWRCTPGLTWERDYLEVEPVVGRRTPFAIEYPLVLSSRTSLLAPPAWQLASTAPRSARGDDAFASWSASTAASPGTLVLTLEAALKRGEFGAERYAAFRGMLDEALRSVAHPVRAEPGAQSAAAPR